jgi:hypothetical protein
MILRAQRASGSLLCAQSLLKHIFETICRTKLCPPIPTTCSNRSVSHISTFCRCRVRYEALYTVQASPRAPQKAGTGAHMSASLQKRTCRNHTYERWKRVSVPSPCRHCSVVCASEISFAIVAAAVEFGGGPHVICRKMGAPANGIVRL